MYGFNLLPRRFRPGLARVDLSHLAALGSLLIVLGLALSGLLGLTYRAHVLEIQVVELERQLADLEPAIGAVQQTVLEREKFQALNEDYEALISRRQDWLAILGEIDSLTPVNMWLTTIKVMPPGVSGEIAEPGGEVITSGEDSASSEMIAAANALMIHGQAWDVAAVGVFINNLHLLPQFDNVQLHHLRGAKNGQVDFALTAYIKGDSF